MIKTYGTELKFKKHAYSNCRIIANVEYNTDTKDAALKDIVLISYSTPVLKYNVKTEELECYGLYSMTTRRHIGWFTQVLQGVAYYDVKDNVGGSIKDVRLKVGWETAFKQKSNWLPDDWLKLKVIMGK